MLTVHVRVSDASTGRPVPARLRITDAAGRYYPPLGRYADFRTGPGEDVGGQVLLGGRAYAYTDGACEVRLPPGLLRAEVSRGPEYVPAVHEVNLAAGQLALRLSLGRWTDERAAGWWPGDARAHELSPHAAVLEGAAEGLSVVQLLARERPERGEMPAAAGNLLAFSGTQACVRSPECLAVVNTLNAHDVLGTVALLHCHRPVFPLRFTGPDWSVADWCDQCHRKRGLTVWGDLPRLTEEHPQGEALAAMLLGKIDAFEVGRSGARWVEARALYGRLLACGLRPALVGGSGKESNAQALGAVRTYARLKEGEELTTATWIEAVRAGRTYVTSGPLLSLSVCCAGREYGPGEVVRAEPGARVRIGATARSTTRIERLDLQDSEERVSVNQGATQNGPVCTAMAEAEYEVRHSGWLTAACTAEGRLPGEDRLFATATPVWLEVAGHPCRPRPDQAAPLHAALEQTLRWVDQAADGPGEKQRGRLRGVLRAAQQDLQRRGGA
jgi:hypothetical protein